MNEKGPNQSVSVKFPERKVWLHVKESEWPTSYERHWQSEDNGTKASELWGKNRIHIQLTYQKYKIDKNIFLDIQDCKSVTCPWAISQKVTVEYYGEK